MDRFLGILFGLLTLACAGTLVFIDFSWVLFVWALALGAWVLSGIQDVEVGWRAQVLFLGQRLRVEVGEGWRWCPFPFGVKPADCRWQTLELEAIETTTLDDVRVKIGGTITWHPTDLDTYHSVHFSGIKKILEETREEDIRTRVRQLPLETPEGQVTIIGVLDSQKEFADHVKTALGAIAPGLGVEISGVAIPRILVSDPEVAENLERDKKEALQKKATLSEAGTATALRKILIDGDFTEATAEALVKARVAGATVGDQKITLDEKALEAILRVLGGRL